MDILKIHLPHQKCSSVTEVLATSRQNSLRNGWISWYCTTLHPQSLTWNLKIAPWKSRFLLETIMFGFHVKILGCINLTLETFTSTWEAVEAPLWKENPFRVFLPRIPRFDIWAHDESAPGWMNTWVVSIRPGRWTAGTPKSTQLKAGRSSEPDPPWLLYYIGGLCKGWWWWWWWWRLRACQNPASQVVNARFIFSDPETRFWPWQYPLRTSVEWVNLPTIFSYKIKKHVPGFKWPFQGLSDPHLGDQKITDGEAVTSRYIQLI